MKRVLFFFLIIFTAIQFIRPEKNNHVGPQPNDISALHPIPTNVNTILSKACKDCHTNNTRYPWYSNVQPVAWFLANHITDGKRSFNLNEFVTYPVWRQYDKISEIKKQIDKNSMPLSSYTLIHRDAILSNTEKNIVETWSENIRQQMESKYPKDSLEKPLKH